MMPCSGHRVGRLLDQAVSRRPLLMGLLYEQGPELLDLDRGSGKSMVYLLDIEALKIKLSLGTRCGLKGPWEDESTNRAVTGVYALDLPL